MNKKTVCESESIELTCPVGRLISIQFAMYGRVSQSICESSRMNSDKCVSNIGETVEIVAKICNFKNSCQFNANSDLLGDPCEKFSKYLDIKFECI